MNKTEDEIVIEACVDSILKLIKQGKPSYDTKEKSCMYRENGTASCPVRCAVGHMIKDEHYDPYLENQSVDNKEVRALVAKSLGISSLSEKQETVLSYLQEAHDTCYTKDDQEFGERFLEEFDSILNDHSFVVVEMGGSIFKSLAKHGVY